MLCTGSQNHCVCSDSSAAHHLFRVQKKGKLKWGRGSTGQEFLLFCFMQNQLWETSTSCQSKKQNALSLRLFALKGYLGTSVK